MNHDAKLKRYTVIAATTASFLTPFMVSAVNLAVPSIGEDFNAGAFLLSWVVTSYLLASAAFLLPVGRLSDIVGRRKIFILGISLFSLFSFLCGIAISIEMLIFFRILQGMASAMIFSTSVAIITSVFPPQERGKAIGITVASVYIGLSLGPVLGGILNHNLGWHSIFYFNTLLGLLTFFFISRLRVEWAEGESEKFDLPGAFLYFAGLTIFMYGISSITNSPWAKYICGVGTAVLAVFIVYQMRAPHPLINLRLFSRNITFAFSNLAALINYSATFSVVFLLSLYLQVVKGYDSQMAGMILLFQPGMMALISPVSGRLADRIEPRILASVGMVVNAASLAVFSFLGKDTPLWFLIGNLILMGVGLALFISPNTTAVMCSVERKYFGVASSTVGTMRLVGQAVSMALVTLVITSYVGNVELNMASTDLLIRSFRVAFMISAITCFAGVFASLARGNIKDVKISDNTAECHRT